MGSDYTQIALTVGGMYLVLKYGLPEIWEKINPIPPIEPPPPSMTLSKSTVTNGDFFEVSVVGLKPDTPAYYGWAMYPEFNIIFEKQVAIGHLYGVRLPFKFTEQVKAETQPGDYEIYYDQSPFGGYYLHAPLKVI